MPALLTNNRQPCDLAGHDLTVSAAKSSGHRLVAHAREALAAGDEVVALLMLRLAYEAFDRTDRGEAA